MNPSYVLFNEAFVKLMALMLAMSASFIVGTFMLITLMIKMWDHIIII